MPDYPFSDYSKSLQAQYPELQEAWAHAPDRPEKSPSQLAIQNMRRLVRARLGVQVKPLLNRAKGKSTVTLLIEPAVGRSNQESAALMAPIQALLEPFIAPRGAAEPFTAAGAFHRRFGWVQVCQVQPHVWLPGEEDRARLAQAERRAVRLVQALEDPALPIPAPRPPKPRL